MIQDRKDLAVDSKQAIQQRKENRTNVGIRLGRNIKTTVHKLRHVGLLDSQVNELCVVQ